MEISEGIAGKQTGVVVVDMQGDFTQLKSGSLAVEGTGLTYLHDVDKATRIFREKGLKIFATQDWHPADHISFFSNTPGKQPFDTIEINGNRQILWPPHCVQDSENARLLLDENLFEEIVRKGTDPAHDSYSGFQDDGGIETRLDTVLKSAQINTVIVYGLATDFCVKATAMDALDRGYGVVVITSLCKGVAPDSTTEALEQMQDRGIILTEESDPDVIASLLS